MSLFFTFFKSKRIKEKLNDFLKLRVNSKTTVCALDNISFTIYTGSIVGLLGSNGAGKSTLLKVIAGVYAPTKGRVKVKTKKIHLLSLGLGFDANATGYENIYLSSHLRGFTKAEIDKVRDNIIEFAGLGEKIYNPVKTYSSGMRSRLAFSISTHFEPDVLLIDEALSVGDANFQQKSLEKMKRLIHDEKRTVILASHSLGTLREICDEVLWLENGRVVAFGPTEEILSMYEEKVKEDLAE